MHPAFSVIVFTAASGAGYGLLIAVAAATLAAPAALGRPLALVAIALALALVVGGLASSTLHLGRPERAWRALSQWRSSWLSREGVAAILSFPPAGLLGLAWIASPEPGIFGGFAALATIAAAVVTLYCTAMIYASLKTIRQWRHGLTAPNYLALGLFTGALVLAALAGGAAPFLIAALGLGFAALCLKLLYWRGVARQAPASTAESATGLGRFGAVRLFEAPHTEENYLMREMGFSIARKHATKLRRLALVALFAAPLALIALGLLAGGWIAAGAAVLAACSAGVGVLTERWLFFAEATHVVTLYYGARAA